LKEQKENCPLQGKKSFFRASWTKGGAALIYFSGELGNVESSLYNLAERSRVELIDSVLRPSSAILLKGEDQVLFTSDMEKRDFANIYFKELSAESQTLMIKAPYTLGNLAWVDVTMEQLATTRSSRAKK
jgi:hypothetical protein